MVRGFILRNIRLKEEKGRALRLATSENILKKVEAATLKRRASELKQSVDFPKLEKELGF